MSEAAVARRPAEGAAGLTVLLRLFAIPVLGFFAFGLALALGLRSDRMLLVGLAIATATLILEVVALDRTRPRDRRNLLLSIFSFSYVVFFVVPVFLFYVGDIGYTERWSPSPIPLTPRDVTRGMLVALVGYATLLAGYVLPLGRLAADVVPRMKREWSAETTLGVALLTIPLGWSVTLASQFGLIPERAGSGFLGAISQGTSFGIGLIVLCYQRYRSRMALLLLALVIPPTMFFNFFTSSKILFLMPLVLIVVVHVIVTRRLRAWWIVGFVAVMAVFYPVSKTYREFMVSNNLSAVQVIASPQRALHLITNFASSFEPGEYLSLGLETTGNRLDSLGILSVIVRDSGTRVPFQGGWSIGYVAVAYIPRFLWPDKPGVSGIGRWVTAYFGYGPHIDSSTASTVMGEFYFNFGWTGVIVGMALLGVWFRFLQDSFLRIDATIPAMLAGVVAILTLASGIGGHVFGVTNTVILNIAPIMMMHIVVRTITPPPARLPPPL